jgi:carbamate kinase
MGKRVLVALGGNAIKQPDEKGTFEEQMKNVETASKQIAQLVRHGYELVITHGMAGWVTSYPAEAAADQVPPQPLVVLGAMTQGQIGYMMQQTLHNILDGDPSRSPHSHTGVRHPEDPDFEDPTKPVGPFYTEVARSSLLSAAGSLRRSAPRVTKLGGVSCPHPRLSESPRRRRSGRWSRRA